VCSESDTGVLSAWIHGAGCRAWSGAAIVRGTVRGPVQRFCRVDAAVAPGAVHGAVERWCGETRSKAEGKIKELDPRCA
jgi:hypothetical protein